MGAACLGEQYLKRYFNKTILVDLRAKFKTVEDRANSLLLRYTNHQFKNVHAREYARQGFARRVGTLRRCIENIFRVIPPGAVKVPNKSKLHDAQINLHAFMANVYGCVDNLAWVWVHERGLTERISRRQVGLRKNNIQVRSSLSKEFQNYLQGLDKWLDYVTEYRELLGTSDTLVHTAR